MWCTTDFWMWKAFHETTGNGTDAKTTTHTHARSETAQTAVAKGRVRLVAEELLQLEAQLLQGLLVVVLDIEVRKRVLHVAADEVLHRQAAAAPRILLLELRHGVVQRTMRRPRTERAAAW